MAAEGPFRGSESRPSVKVIGDHCFRHQSTPPTASSRAASSRTASCPPAPASSPSRFPLDKFPLDKFPLDKFPLDKFPFGKFPLDKFPLSWGWQFGYEHKARREVDCAGPICPEASRRFCRKGNGLHVLL